MHNFNLGSSRRASWLHRSWKPTLIQAVEARSESSVCASTRWYREVSLCWIIVKHWGECQRCDRLTSKNLIICSISLSVFMLPSAPCRCTDHDASISKGKLTHRDNVLQRKVYLVSLLELRHSAISISFLAKKFTDVQFQSYSWKIRLIFVSCHSSSVDLEKSI